MRRDRIARARSGLRRVLRAMFHRPCGPGSGATRSLAAVFTWPVERLAGGDILAHHVDPDGKRYSRFYDLRGNPLGPPLPQLFRIPTGETSRRYVFPTADGLFWPISHSGSPEPLPKEVLGVIPLVSRAQWYLTCPWADAHHRSWKRPWARPPYRSGPLRPTP